MVNLNVFEFTLFDSLWQGDYCHNTVTTHYHVIQITPTPAPPTHPKFKSKRHENRHIIWYFNAGRWWVSTKNLNLVVALTCFRLEGTELFPLLTGDKTNYNYASKLFSFGFQHQSELSLRSANQSPSTCCDLSEYFIGSWTFFYFNPRWNFYLFSIEWNISPWQSGVKNG